MEQGTPQPTPFKIGGVIGDPVTVTGPSMPARTVDDSVTQSGRKIHLPSKDSSPKSRRKAKTNARSQSDGSSTSSDSSDSEPECHDMDPSSSEKDSAILPAVKKHRKALVESKIKDLQRELMALDNESDDDEEADTEAEQVLNSKSQTAKLLSLRKMQRQDGLDMLQMQLQLLQAQIKTMRQAQAQQEEEEDLSHPRDLLSPESASHERNLGETCSAPNRVDQLWDATLHDYKLTETVADQGSDKWDQYIFTVRRRFDWEHKYQETLVDIKSKTLKEALQHIMVGVKGIGLIQDTPSIDPNTLFLYLEETREFMYRCREKSKDEKISKKERKSAATKALHLGVLVNYLDKDYAETRKTLRPMLENGLITFDLLWALFKPNLIAYTTTYGDQDHPRAFKVDFATKRHHFMKGTWYEIEGKYLEYDGKSFGLGSMSVQISSFQGVRKISSLECFPIQFHKEAPRVKSELIERGKKFVAMKGVHYKYHKGMAFMKKKRQVLKINIDGRIMCDPAIHRRINPNYHAASVGPKELDDEGRENSDEDDDGCDYGGDSSSEEADGHHYTPSSSEDSPPLRRRFRLVKYLEGRPDLVEVNSQDKETANSQKDQLESEEDSSHTFSEEELLIASPVVLGFSFNEKLWLEFTVSGISDVKFNEDAFDSLVLPESQKSIVKALVSSHTFHPSKSIDDIISGKGRGLCCVLHGPPGTGKTLTAEGIADLLKCPLYMVSAGDLGTDPRSLEKELQTILDIAHSWGAILLLDEADVFLEKRSVQSIHRNALVSIFLRLLEYFQGILFLTTNRVETFDEAFVSRIHLSLRYDELSTKARYRVWKLFLDKIKATEGIKVGTLTENDYKDLARRDVNGRQIKNLVRAAQALAIHQDEPLSMAHIKRVIDVAENFERDLKGGSGYTDAMRSYT
ncbi:hypothetical protein DV738_g314, partial [Chaetothyriales sp. CBS 135597]